MFDKDSGEISVVDEQTGGNEAALEQDGADLDREAAGAKASATEPAEKRELKRRILLVRIRRKISKLPKKISMVPKAMRRMFFLPFGSKFKGNKSGDNNDAADIENCIILTSPKSIQKIFVCVLR